MLRCRALLPLPEVFVPLQTSPLKRSKRIINAANLKRCKSESRIASRSVCAFPVSAAARKSVPVCRSHERGRNLEGEVIKLGGAISERKAKSFAIHFGSLLARPPNIQGIRRVWGKNLTLPRKLGTTSLGGDQRSFLPPHFPSAIQYASFHPRILFTICFCLVLSSVASSRSKTRGCEEREREDFCYAYLSINIFSYSLEA